MNLDYWDYLKSLSWTYEVALALWVAAVYQWLKSLLLARRTALAAPNHTRWINLGLSCWILLAGATLAEIYFVFIYTYINGNTLNNSNVRLNSFKQIEPMLDYPRFLAGLSLTYLLLLRLSIAAGFWVLKRLLLARQAAHALPNRLNWIHLGLSCWILLAFMTNIEMYFAFIYDQSDSFNMTNVSQRWFRRHVQKNPQDFRDDRPLEKTAPPGVHRIWFAGDSFTFGHGVKNVADRFSDRVGADLERQHAGKFAVSNVAEAGISIAHVEKLIQLHLDHGYQFDTLVYVICLNDIEVYVDERGERYEHHRELGPPMILRDTYFFNLIWYRVSLAMQPQVQNYYSDLAAAYEEGEPRRRFLQKLDDLRALCARHQVDLRVAIFPFLHNLGPEYPFAAAHRTIVEHCQENDIPVLDLAPVLEPHIGEGLVVNRFDAHPNERAHQLAADAMERELLPDLMK